MRELQNFVRHPIRDMSSKNTEMGVHPDLFVEDLDFDKRKCKRTVALEVLNLSMPRTGTLCMYQSIILKRELWLTSNIAMKKALKTLGYNDVYHFNNIHTNSRDADIWIELMDAKHNNEPRNWRAEFDYLLGHCAVVSDVPCIFFAKELVEAYPEAKVILDERDIEEWMPSLEEVIDTTSHSSFLDKKFVGRTSEVITRWQRYYMNAKTPGEVRVNARTVYRQHYEEMRKLVPKERLLEYTLGSGWEPLCNFLGKRVPGVPFPRVNEAALVKDRTRIHRRRIFWTLFGKLPMIISLFAVAKFALVWRLRAREKLRWLKNPYRFDPMLLAGLDI